MKRKDILYLLCSLLIAVIYSILSLIFLLPFKEISFGIIFSDVIILSYLFLKKGIRNLIKFSLLFFIILLVILSVNYFTKFFITNLYIYLLLFLDFIILLILYIRRSLKQQKTAFDKLFKFIVVTIPIIIIFYIVYVNLAPFGQSISFINQPEEENFLTNSRVTNATVENFNNIALVSNLVYFDKTISTGIDKINIKIKFYNNFPENNILLRLGAKDREDWHYQYKMIYNPILDSLNMNLIQEGSLRLYQEENKFTKIGDFLKNIPENSIVATDQELWPQINLIPNYKPSTLVINATLRGTYNFYVYVKGNLKVDIIKRDLNWYENEDELNINLYSLNNILLANSTIKDDGIIKADNKAKTNDQSGYLIANLQEGVYRLELKNNGDMIIKKITLNQNKIVTNSLFLADNPLYGINIIPRTVYTRLNKDSSINLKTYHKEGLQKIKLNNQTININKINEEIGFNLKTSKDFYELTTEKNDILINSIDYFSFTKDSYFEPFKYKIVPIKNDVVWLKNNVDFVYTDYTEPIKEGNWIIAEATFNINETYINNNKLNFLINTPHLAITEYQNYTIPIDYVNTIYIKESIQWK